MFRNLLVDLAIKTIILFGILFGSFWFVVFVAGWSFGHILDSAKLGLIIFGGFTTLGVSHIWNLLKKGQKLQAVIFLILIVLIISCSFYFFWDVAKPGLL
jgi:hypothetical protein